MEERSKFRLRAFKVRVLDRIDGVVERWWER